MIVEAMLPGQLLAALANTQRLVLEAWDRLFGG